MRNFVTAAILGLAAADQTPSGNTSEGNSAGVNDPSACAADLAEAVASVTAASNSIIQGVAACPPQDAGQDSLCASSIISAAADFSATSQALAGASVTCANTLATRKGAYCGGKISQSIKAMSIASVSIIRSTDSCKPSTEGGDSFECVADVVDTVDALANSAGSIEDAVVKCAEAAAPNPALAYLYDTWAATGCTALPEPAWIQWGTWYQETDDATVWDAMYDMCGGAAAVFNVSLPMSFTYAHHCCDSNDGTCTVTCTKQTQWTGAKAVNSPYEHEEALPVWPAVLE